MGIWTTWANRLGLVKAAYESKGERLEIFVWKEGREVVALYPYNLSWGKKRMFTNKHNLIEKLIRCWSKNFHCLWLKMDRVKKANQMKILFTLYYYRINQSTRLNTMIHWVSSPGHISPHREVRIKRGTDKPLSWIKSVITCILIKVSWPQILQPLNRSFEYGQLQNIGKRNFMIKMNARKKIIGPWWKW